MIKLFIKKLFFHKSKIYEFGLVSINQVVMILGSLVVFKLMSTSLTVIEYGYYALLGSLISLSLTLLFNPFEQGISRYVNEYQKKGKLTTLTAAVGISYLFIFVFLFLGIYIALFTGLIKGIWAQMAIPTLIFLAAEVLRITIVTIEIARRNRIAVIRITGADILLKMLLIFSLKHFHFLSLSHLFLFFALGDIIAVIQAPLSEYVCFQAKITYSQLCIALSNLYGFSKPLLIWGLFVWIRDMANRWYLNAYVDKLAVAQFSVIFTIAGAIPTAVQTAIVNFILPIVYQEHSENKKFLHHLTLKLVISLLVMFCAATIFIGFFHDYFIIFLSEKRYTLYGSSLPYLFFFCSIFCISNVTTFEIFANKKTDLLYISSIIPTFISLVLGYFLIHLYGIQGAFINATVTYILISISTFLVVILHRKGTL